MNYGPRVDESNREANSDWQVTPEIYPESKDHRVYKSIN